MKLHHEFSFYARLLPLMGSHILLIGLAHCVRRSQHAACKRFLNPLIIIAAVSSFRFAHHTSVFALCWVFGILLMYQ